MIRRRDFITLLSGAAAWPLAARAQLQSAPTVGFLHPGVPETNVQRVEALRKGLSETGYIEGRNVRIEFGWARDDGTRLAELAADLVRRRVAVIFASGGIGALAAKAATPSIPIRARCVAHCSAGQPGDPGFRGDDRRGEGRCPGD